MGLFKSLFGDSQPEDEPMYEVKIKGTIQAGGPKPINKTVLMDRTQMQYFTGRNRYEAIEGWIRANYPGATIPNIRNFGTESKLVKK